MRTLVLSDLHIGSKGCNPKEILSLLKEEKVERYILVGDIIDGWLFKKYKSFSPDQIKVIRRFLKISKDKEVVWIAGNHDEFLRQFIPMEIGNIKICDEFIENGVWFCHGDRYDGIVKMAWLGKLGSVGYDLAIILDRFLKKMGLKNSLSKYLKDNVKAAVSFMTNFENEMARQAKKRNCHTVVCGHIHNPADKIIDGIRYVNTGDYVENRSKAIYHPEYNTVLVYNHGERINYRNSLQK
jgi:UDP-2,3-diacylglucosamine pyrophosphatase LpxH